MNFLFDNVFGDSIHKELKGWKEAEKYASDNTLKLLGEFICWVDEETLEEIYIN